MPTGVCPQLRRTHSWVESRVREDLVDHRFYLFFLAPNVSGDWFSLGCECISIRGQGGSKRENMWEEKKARTLVEKNAAENKKASDLLQEVTASLLSHIFSASFSSSFIVRR